MVLPMYARMSEKISLKVPHERKLAYLECFYPLPELVQKMRRFLHTFARADWRCNEYSIHVDATRKIR